MLCDEQVLRTGVGAKDYARTLARSVASCALPVRSSASVALGGESLLRLRMDRLIDPGGIRLMKRHAIPLALALLLLLAGSFMPLSSSAGDEPVEFDIPPRALHTVAPTYPEEAIEAGIEGELHFQVCIDDAGDVAEIKVVKVEEGQQLLEAAAVEALRQWTFSPALKDDKPVPSQILLPIRFQLDGEEEKTRNGNEEESASTTGSDGKR
jgi:TonB family protein